MAPMTLWVALIAAVRLCVHLAVAGNYGWFRDELYYLAAGRRLDWGYVDFPPLVAWLAALLDTVAPGSLVAMHVPPALAAGATVVVAGLLARELGGKALAQVLAALASCVSLIGLAQGSIFSIDVWDQLWWAVLTLVLARLLRRDDPRFWLLFGAVAGIALLTKVTVVAFGAALVVGVLLSPFRRHFRTRWPWLGGLLALACAVPYLLWNAGHGWPTVEFWSHYGAKLADVSPLGFTAQAVLLVNPLTVVLWAGGLRWLLVGGGVVPYRPMAVAFLMLFTVLALGGSKVYFVAPAFLAPLAAGAVWLGRASRKRWVRRAVAGYGVGLASSGVLLLPLAVPLLPPAEFARTFGFLGADAGAQMERHEASVLPQWLADRLGWPEVVDAVAQAHATLPEADQRQACIITANYGEAGAIEQLGRGRGLPPVISGHNTHWVWGPGGCNGAVLLTVGIPAARLEGVFVSLDEVARVRCTYCMPYEDGVPVYVGRQLALPIAEAWRRFKHFD